GGSRRRCPCGLGRRRHQKPRRSGTGRRFHGGGEHTPTPPTPPRRSARPARPCHLLKTMARRADSARVVRFIICGAAPTRTRRAFRSIAEHALRGGVEELAADRPPVFVPAAVPHLDGDP